MIYEVPRRFGIQNYSDIKNLYPIAHETDVTYSDASSASFLNHDMMEYFGLNNSGKEYVGEFRIIELDNFGDKHAMGLIPIIMGTQVNFKTTTTIHRGMDVYCVYINETSKSYLAFKEGDTLTAEETLFVANNKLLYKLVHNYNYTSTNPNYGFLVLKSTAVNIIPTTWYKVSPSSPTTAGVAVLLSLSGGDIPDIGSGTINCNLVTDLMIQDQYGYKTIITHNSDFVCFGPGSSTDFDPSLISTEYVRV